VSLRVLGAALIKDGSDYRQAEAHVRSALSLAVELGLRPEGAHALQALSHVQSAQGRKEESRRSIALSRSIYEELKMDYWVQQQMLLPAPLATRSCNDRYLRAP
jgi:hypothetical protein